MRHPYIPDAGTYNNYKTALDNNYGYIYHVQSGSGIGGFFKKMMNFVIPLGKSALQKGYELAKPELSKLVDKGAQEAGKFAVNQLERGRVSLQDKLSKKRTRDQLS